MLNKKYRKALLAVTYSFLIVSPIDRVAAAVYGWNGTTSSDMSNNLNWSPNTVPGAGDTGSFSTASGTTSTSPTISLVTINPGTFSLTGSTAYAFNVSGIGGVINFALPGGISNGSSLTQNVSINSGGRIAFAANTLPSSTSPVSYSLVGGNLQYNGNYTDLTNSDVSMISSSNLTVVGTGIVTISSLSTDATSTVVLNSGNITINNPGASGTVAGTITGGVASSVTAQGAGSTLILTNTSNNYGSNNVGAGATLQGATGAIKGNVNVTGTGTLDLEQPIATSATFSGLISGGGNLAVNAAGGSGTIVLSNPLNSFTGTTTIGAGTLSVTNIGAIQSSTGIVNNATLDFNTTGNYTYPISGTGGITVEAGVGTTQLSGAVSYQGTTVVNTGTLELDSISTLPGQITLAAGTFIDFNQVPITAGVVSGPITGTGGVIINGNAGTGTVVFSSTLNNYSGNTTILGGQLQTFAGIQPGNVTVTSPGIFDLEQPTGSTGTFSGLITGTGNVAVNNGGNGGTVVLGNGSNSYSGTTTVTNGELAVYNLSGLGTGDLIANSAGKLTFHQSVNANVGHTLLGTGTIVKRGVGTLRYNTSQAAFAGLTEVRNGKLHIDDDLGGNLVAREIGILKGNGRVLGDVHIAQLGGIEPGDSTVDTIRVGGNFRQTGLSTYYVQAQVLPDNSAVQASLIDVTGFAEITPNGTEPIALSLSDRAISPSEGSGGGFGTNVNVNLLGNGQLPLGQTLTTTILHANGGVAGSYGYAIGNYPLLSPVLSYGANDIYLTLTNTLAILPVTFNEEQVSEQLQRITSPTPEEQAVLVGITSLPRGEAREALDQLTGEQYTSTLFAAELANRGFMRRLYDPVRLIINTPYETKAAPCGCDHPLEFDTWADASGHQYFMETGQNFHQVEISGYEFSIGAQMSLYDYFTLGAAYSYGKDFTDYKVGGDAKTMVNLGGVYGLFRPSCYYVLADVVFGCSHNKIARQIDIGDLSYRPRSNVKVWQMGYYVEAGKDFLWKYVLAQPFVALEGGHYRFDSFEEYGSGPLNLNVDRKTVTPAYTRFGFHLTTRDRPSWWSFGVDLAWMYRLTSYGTKVNEEFQDFGLPFYIEGLHLSRNSFEAAVNFSVLFCRNWEVYGEVTTQSWANTTTYSFLGGLSASW